MCWWIGSCDILKDGKTKNTPFQNSGKAHFKKFSKNFVDVKVKFFGSTYMLFFKKMIWGNHKFYLKGLSVYLMFILMDFEELQLIQNSVGGCSGSMALFEAFLREITILLK